MSPSRKRPDEDIIGYALRLTLYATCIVAPFVALITGALDSSETVAAALALLGATTGGVALTQARREGGAKTSAYREGVGHGLITDVGPPGRHALDPEGDDQ